MSSKSLAWTYECRVRCASGLPFNVCSAIDISGLIVRCVLLDDSTSSIHFWRCSNGYTFALWPSPENEAFMRTNFGGYETLFDGRRCERRKSNSKIK